MKSTELFLPVALITVVLSYTGTTHAEGVRDLRQPSSMQQSVFEDDGYVFLVPHAPADESQPDHGNASDDHGTGHQEDAAGHDQGGQHESQGDHGGGEGGGEGHGEGHGGWLLKTPPALEERGIKIHGFLSQGISGVANNPVDGYNGVVAFNDRDGEYQMNQLWLTMVRETHTDGCGFDVGGRVDFMYGTDARFMESVDGLEATWDQEERFYHAALPQLYLDVAYNDWTFRFGHFFTFLEYEEEEATENFFYSYSYTKEYGEPATHTGMLGIYDLADQLTLKAGFHRGWNQFDDTDGFDSLGFLGGVTWTSCDGRKTVYWGITSGEQGPGNNTVMYNLVASLDLTDRFTYVVQHDYGQSFNSGRGPGHGFDDGEWYGLNQYFLYEICSHWSAGMRFEWFRDDQGTRVAGHGDGNLTHHGGFAGDFYELTAGLNWRPGDNVRVRPEVRWDWFDGRDGGLGHRPYDAGDQNSQFMFGCDLIVLF